MNISVIPRLVVGIGMIIAITLKYCKYLLVHKYYVFVAGRKLGVPLWRLVIHDWSKFTYHEFYPYALTFFGPWNSNDRPQWLVDNFNAAWRHHQDHNPHHWQHWRDKGFQGFIPKTYVREMVADWIAMDRNKILKVKSWYIQNRDEIVLSGPIRDLVESLLDEYEGEYK